MSPVCQIFVQNAWGKNLCSNCFRSKEDHWDVNAPNRRNNSSEQPPRRYIGITSRSASYSRNYYTKNSWNPTMLDNSSAECRLLKSPGLIKDMDVIIKKETEKIGNEICETVPLLNEVIPTDIWSLSSVILDANQPKGIEVPEKEEIVEDLKGIILDGTPLESRNVCYGPKSSGCRSILKGGLTSGGNKSVGSSVSFKADEECIGYGGDVDYSDVDDDDYDNFDDGDDDSASISSSELAPDERELKYQTKANTNFNSDNDSFQESLGSSQLTNRDTESPVSDTNVNSMSETLPSDNFSEKNLLQKQEGRVKLKRSQPIGGVKPHIKRSPDVDIIEEIPLKGIKPKYVSRDQEMQERITDEGLQQGEGSEGFLSKITSIDAASSKFTSVDDVLINKFNCSNSLPPKQTSFSWNNNIEESSGWLVNGSSTSSESEDITNSNNSSIFKDPKLKQINETSQPTFQPTQASVVEAQVCEKLLTANKAAYGSKDLKMRASHIKYSENAEKYALTQEEEKGNICSRSCHDTEQSQSCVYPLNSINIKRRNSFMESQLDGSVYTLETNCKIDVKRDASQANTLKQDASKIDSLKQDGRKVDSLKQDGRKVDALKQDERKIDSLKQYGIKVDSLKQGGTKGNAGKHHMNNAGKQEVCKENCIELPTKNVESRKESIPKTRCENFTTEQSLKRVLQTTDIRKRVCGDALNLERQPRIQTRNLSQMETVSSLPPQTSFLHSGAVHPSVDTNKVNSVIYSTPYSQSPSVAGIRNNAKFPVVPKTGKPKIPVKPTIPEPPTQFKGFSESDNSSQPESAANLPSPLDDTRLLTQNEAGNSSSTNDIPDTKNTSTIEVPDGSPTSSTMSYSPTSSSSGYSTTSNLSQHVTSESTSEEKSSTSPIHEELSTDKRDTFVNEILADIRNLQLTDHCVNSEKNQSNYLIKKQCIPEKVLPKQCKPKVEEVDKTHQLLAVNKNNVEPSYINLRDLDSYSSFTDDFDDDDLVTGTSGVNDSLQRCDRSLSDSSLCRKSPQLSVQSEVGCKLPAVRSQSVPSSIEKGLDLLESAEVKSGYVESGTSFCINGNKGRTHFTKHNSIFRKFLHFRSGDKSSLKRLWNQQKDKEKELAREERKIKLQIIHPLDYNTQGVEVIARPEKRPPPPELPEMIISKSSECLSRQNGHVLSRTHSQEPVHKKALSLVSFFEPNLLREKLRGERVLKRNSFLRRKKKTVDRNDSERLKPLVTYVKKSVLPLHETCAINQETSVRRNTVIGSGKNTHAQFSNSGNLGCNSEGRPRPPPPPRKTSLEGQTNLETFAIPKQPPISASLKRSTPSNQITKLKPDFNKQKRTASSASSSQAVKDSLYANLGNARASFTPSKPDRPSSLLEDEKPDRPSSLLEDEKERRRAPQPPDGGYNRKPPAPPAPPNEVVVPSYENVADCQAYSSLVRRQENLEDFNSSNLEGLSNMLEQISTVLESRFDKLPILQNVKGLSDVIFRREDPVTCGPRLFYRGRVSEVEVTVMMTSENKVEVDSLLMPVPLASFRKDLEDLPFTPVEGLAEQLTSGSVWVLPPLKLFQIEEFSRACCLRMQDWEKKVCVFLLQLVTALKQLQARGVEETSLELILVGVGEGEAHSPRLILVAPEENGGFNTVGRSCISLCQCAAITTLLLLSPSQSLEGNELVMPPQHVLRPRAFSALVQTLREEKANSLTKAKCILELMIFGPNDLKIFAQPQPEVALQKWLNLERFIALQTPIEELNQVQDPLWVKFHFLFLSRANCRVLLEAIQAMESPHVINL